jgi:hypothetical protein
MHGALSSSTNITTMITSKGIRWVGLEEWKEENGGTYRVLVAIHEGKRPLRIDRCPCENNIKVDLKGREWKVVDWIDLAQDRDKWRVTVSTMMTLLFSKNAKNFLRR